MSLNVTRGTLLRIPAAVVLALAVGGCASRSDIRAIRQDMQAQSRNDRNFALDMVMAASRNTNRLQERVQSLESAWTWDRPECERLDRRISDLEEKAGPDIMEDCWPCPAEVGGQCCPSPKRKFW